MVVEMDMELTRPQVGLTLHILQPASNINFRWWVHRLFLHSTPLTWWSFRIIYAGNYRPRSSDHWR